MTEPAVDSPLHPDLALLTAIFRNYPGVQAVYLFGSGATRRYDFAAFVGDPEHYGSAERFLHLAIGAINDMGNHIVADDNLGDTNWYSDIPTER